MVLGGGKLFHILELFSFPFQLGVGYLFFPVAYAMGINENVVETLSAAQLMGVKTVVNEFIAYKKLGQMVAQNPPLLSVCVNL